MASLSAKTNSVRSNEDQNEVLVLESLLAHSFFRAKAYKVVKFNKLLPYCQNSLSNDLENLKNRMDLLKARMNRAPIRSTPIEEYDTSKRPGYVVVFSMEKFSSQSRMKARRGANEDIENIKLTFQDHLKYEVDVHKNCDKEKLHDLMGQMSEKFEKHGYSSLIVFVLTHGGRYEDNSGTAFVESDILYDVNGQKIYIYKDLVNVVSNDQCPALVNKPKIFLIQACRGRELNEIIHQAGYLLDEAPSNPSKSPIIPQKSDYIIVQATLPSHVALRDPEKGSIFIRQLCESLKAYNGESFLDLLVFTNNKICSQESFNLMHDKGTGDGPCRCKVKQVCEFTCTFTKRLVLKPIH